MLGHQNWQGLEKVLMKPICFTQEEGRGQGRGSGFPERPVRLQQSCEKNSSLPSCSAEMFPGNDIHRPKVNQTHGRRLPVDVMLYNQGPELHSLQASTVAKVKNILRLREGR